MRRHAIAGTVSLALVAPFVLAQVPAGPEFRVNTSTTGAQNEASITVARNGDFVVAWASSPVVSESNVFGQRYSAAGSPVGGEFRINTSTTEKQVLPAVAMDARGDFVATWETYGAAQGAFGQRFAAGGQAVGGEFTITTGSAEFPRVARAPAGDFVVAWYWTPPPGPGHDVAARLFAPDAAPRGPQFQVPTATTGQQQRPAAAMDAAGNFVVVWEDYVFPSPPRDVWGRRFDAAGSPIGAPFRVNTYTTNEQSDPEVAMAPNGEFVVTWTSQGQDGTFEAVFGQRFDAGGAPRGGEFQVDSYTFYFQNQPALAMDDTGAFVVAWSSWRADGQGYGVQGQRFDAQGVKRGAEFRVNTYTTGNQFIPAVASDPVGNFVVAWWSEGQDGSGVGVFAQRFGGLRPTALSADTVGNLVLEPGETVAIRPTWRNESGAAQIVSTQVASPGGPPGGVPAIVGPIGAYGTIANGASATCTTCPVLNVPSPSPRPVLHWDATVIEAVTPDAQGQRKRWTLHVGDTFTDVPRNNAFYRFIEVVFHNGVMSECGPTTFCPSAPVVRDQMARFVLLARDPLFVPPGCVAGSEIFADVPASSPYCPWVEELVRRGVVTGCGGGSYCPTLVVTRESLAVYVLKTLEGPAFFPPPCGAPIFNDVPAASGFCPWVEELARRGVVTGCGGGAYCPTLAVSREQMSVFLTVTFGLVLYGP